MVWLQMYSLVRIICLICVYHLNSVSSPYSHGFSTSQDALMPHWFPVSNRIYFRKHIVNPISVPLRWKYFKKFFISIFFFSVRALSKHKYPICTTFSPAFLSFSQWSWTQVVFCLSPLCNVLEESSSCLFNCTIQI